MEILAEFHCTLSIGGNDATGTHQEQIASAPNQSPDGHHGPPINRACVRALASSGVQVYGDMVEQDGDGARWLQPEQIDLPFLAPSCKIAHPRQFQ